jgi:tripartite-type tricarboxylate transporter receptor subunit TctC
MKRRPEGTMQTKAASTVLAIALSMAFAGAAPADTWPSRPVTVVVPYPAGAPLDTIVRILSDRLQASLGQPLVIENVTGGAGSIGVSRVVRAAGDGYTVGAGNISSHVSVPAIQNLPFDVVKDLEPVVQLADNAMIILSRSTLPAQDLPALVSWLRANPDKASAGTSGAGGISHVAALLFQGETGTRFRFAAYRGTILAQQDLIGGHIDLLFDQPVTALPNVRAGKEKAHAVMARTRLDAAPDIPTVDEAGVPGLYVSVWSALWAPRGTPRERIGRINDAAVAALTDPATAKRFADLGLSVPSREELTPQALGERHQADVKKWWPIIKAANMNAE